MIYCLDFCLQSSVEFGTVVVRHRVGFFCTVPVIMLGKGSVECA